MRKIIPIIELLTSIIMFIILMFTDISENFMYIIMMTVFVGWIIPYIAIIISSISLLINTYHKLNIIFNFLSLLLCFFLIYFIVKLYDSKMLVSLIEYLIITIITLFNTIYLIIYVKKNPNPEINQIKTIKKQNNGIIK